MTVWGCVIAASSVHAQPAVASLFAPAPRERDPAADLEVQLSALRQRPFAADSEVQPALALVDRAIEMLRAAHARAADDAELQRKSALAWAALSRADRLEAKAHTAAALAGLRAHAEELEAGVQRAKLAYERQAVARSLPAADGVKPTARSEAERAATL
ncbi:MAG: hypothetical protein ABW321_11995, partial [Polyangiales bacterium]